LRVRQAQLLMIRRPEDVDVEIEGHRRDIGTAMRVMRGVAFRRPVALACLPDNMMIGDPSGFDVVPSRKTLSRSPPSLIMLFISVPQKCQDRNRYFRCVGNPSAADY
jgi:hypothetical protein